MQPFLLPWEAIVLDIEKLPHSTNVEEDANAIEKAIQDIKKTDVRKALLTLLRYHKNPKNFPQRVV